MTGGGGRAEAGATHQGWFDSRFAIRNLPFAIYDPRSASFIAATHDMPVSQTSQNVNPSETAKFDRLAARWWDKDGESRPLHDLNPVRLDYVAARMTLKDARVVDVGCGGGILSEALARSGANVVGIDLAPRVLEVARLHLHESGQQVDYRETSAEDLAAQMPGAFAGVTCMELLEHVPDPGSVIAACAALLAPGGRLFVSTLNRTPLAFGAAIVGAEYALNLLPRGTHHYARFIRPAELAAAMRDAGLELEDLSGLAYNPILRRARIVRSTAVNYLACARKP
jgi:2-polyprenyl-6-hydroxyphenyl methylase/3-demethylubiquinone-9 3-methyltransferase